MAVFRAKLANLIGPGEHITHKHNGGWTRNKFDLSLSGRSVTIRQRASVLNVTRSHMRGRLIESSAVSIRGMTTFEEGEAFVWDLCWLLSFATQSQVFPFAFEFDGRKIFRSSGGVYNAWRPPFGGGVGKVSDFVTQAWGNYQLLKDKRALAGLIHMITMSDGPGSVLETQVTTTVQCLECIKSYFALVEGYRFKISEARNGSFIDTKNKSVTFEKLMRLTLGDVGMPLPASFPVVIKLRNAIIHRGFIRETDKVTQFIFGPLKPGAMHTALFETMEQMQDILREFVLRLLGYKGDFLLYTDGARIPKKT